MIYITLIKNNHNIADTNPELNTTYGGLRAVLYIEERGMFHGAQNDVSQANICIIRANIISFALICFKVFYDLFPRKLCLPDDQKALEKRKYIDKSIVFAYICFGVFYDHFPVNTP